MFTFPFTFISSSEATSSTLVATDFSEYTIGSALDDWTDFFGIDNFTFKAAAVSGDNNLGTKCLDFVSATDGRKALTWDKVGTTTDCEILAKIKIDASALDSCGARVCFRVSGSSGNETMYCIEITSSLFRLQVYSGGSVNYAWQRTVETYNTADHWLRVSAIGTTIAAKLWEVTEVEPDDWALEKTDSTITSSGAVGIGAFNWETDFQLDYFACDTTGATVPFPPSGWIPTEFGTFNRGGSNASITTCNFMVGMFNPTGKKLTGLKVFQGSTHTSQLRCAVYSGGASSSDPTGATLLYDFGQTSGVDTLDWFEFTGADVAIPAGELLWIGLKATTGNFSVVYSTNSPNAGDFLYASGRYRLTSGVDPDETVAFPAVLPTASGSSNDSRYAVKIVIEDA